MAFHTPHGSRALPAAVDLVELRLPRAVPRAVGAVPTRASRSRKVESRATGRHGRTPTAATLRAPLIVDALGWRRVLGPGANVQPPEARDLAAASRSTRTAAAPTSTSGSTARLVRHGYAWSVPAARRAARRRRLLRAAPPRQGADQGDRAAARASTPSATRATGSRTALRPAAEDGVFFVGDTAGHCLPLSGEGIRTAFYFGIAAGRELRAVLAGAQTREQALRAYGAFSRRHAPALRVRAPPSSA